MKINYILYSWLRGYKKYGSYEKVFPVATTPSREVPECVKKTNYDNVLVDITSSKDIEIKNSYEINQMRKSCTLAASILQSVGSLVQPGITTDDIDLFVHTAAIEANAYPSPLHYKGFPKSVCTSVNNVAVHGIPDLRPLKNGDIINIDITIFYEGYHGDCSKTFLVGDVDDVGLHLVSITEECLYKAIDICGPGVPYNEIGATIYKHAKKNKLKVLPAFNGHGIGKNFHEPPDIYHTYNHYPGVMQPGVTFTIEPVLSHGSEYVEMLDDGWTVVTEDGARAAQSEHTILITEGGAEILTKIEGS